MNVLQWIVTVSENSKDLAKLIEDHHPWYRSRGLRDAPAPWVGAIAAEAACEQVRQEIMVAGVDETVSPEHRFYSHLGSLILSDQILEQFKLVGEISTILSEAWFGMPEHQSSRRVPGFWVLCDLMGDPPDELEFGEDGV